MEAIEAIAIARAVWELKILPKVYRFFRRVFGKHDKADNNKKKGRTGR
jgi:hypothetical protein